MSYIDMNQPWIYMYSLSRSPLPPPSLPDPSGSSQCTRPEHLSHASNLGECWVLSLLFHSSFTFIIRSFFSSSLLPAICVCMLVAQSCLPLCDLMDCSLPGSFVPGILQARILEWVAIPFSRGSDLPDPGIELWSPTLQADSLPSEPPGKPPGVIWISEGIGISPGNLNSSLSFIQSGILHNVFFM